MDRIVNFKFLSVLIFFYSLNIVAKPLSESQALELDLKKDIFALPSIEESVETLKQKTTSKVDLIFVDFWASWCEPCKESFSFYQEVLKEQKIKKILFVSVNMDDEKEPALKFLKEHAMKEKGQLIINLWDKEKSLMKKLEIEAIPHMVVLSSDGKIKETIRGFNKSTREKVKKILN